MTESNPTDLSRWNRKDRRGIKAHAHITIPGRNMPYMKAIHGFLKNFNELRDKELTQDKNNG